MSKPDGGPAFPPSIAEIQGRAMHSCEFGLAGMSLRDYFAATVLNGMCSNPEENLSQARPLLAKLAYEMADAMWG